MRAFVLTAYGGPSVVEMKDLPAPTPGAGELRIAVKAAGLNPVDFKIREGKLKAISKFELPITMGSELAGVVDAVGEGVTDFVVGDEIYARVAKDRMGAFAEYAVIAAAHAAKKPSKLDFVQAASVPLAALTALQALRDELRLSSGQSVFIPGGAGGVGTFAIQIAKHLGATVTTTASPRGRELVEKLGADRVIDYTKTDFATEVRDQDGVFDLLGGDTLSKAFGVVKKGSTVVSVAGLPEPTTARVDLNAGAGLAFLFWVISTGIRFTAWKHGAKYRYLFMHPSGEDLRYLTKLIESKELEPVVDRVFPFDEIKEAFAYLETGRAKGKVVVRF